MIEKTTETTKAPKGAKASKKTATKMEPMGGAMPTPSPKDGGSDDYEAKSAFDDIMRAEVHKQNPGLMARVQKHVGRHKKVIKSLDDLKKVANMPAEERGEGDTVD